MEKAQQNTSSRSPILSVGVIIETPTGELCLVNRRDAPLGWSLPVAYVEYGESLWRTAERVGREAIGEGVTLLDQFYTYSDPRRDRRCHAVTTIFLANCPVARGVHPSEIKFLSPQALPPMAFDHAQIIADYLEYKRRGVRPQPVYPSSTPTQEVQEFYRRVING